ncbi:putative ABC transporter permease [Bifidobacterium castoris]|uniref:Putative ABC-transporter type IV n=1 Tax=Bifidobacterium castoris TaxID=2306972 RepID=A0A430F953_9BIFI|nr:putative ABC transporter permease [Bifidobacterium castoris]RSX49355.1 putative ABC-transporter type IV [Bifidobacterium castoris]
MTHVILAFDKVFLWFLLYSFVGWLWETCLNIVMKRRFVDRGILNGPLCPIYGFGAMLAVYGLPGEHSFLAVFLSSGVLACTLEYLTSWGIEKLFHMRLWDYSDKPFNINGRVYLNGFIFFGLGCTVIKLWVQPHVLAALDGVPPATLIAVATTLLALTLVDAVITFAGLISMNGRLGRVESDIKALKRRGIARIDVGITAADERIEAAEARFNASTNGLGTRVGAKVRDAGEAVKDTSEQFSTHVHDLFNLQQRRLIDAYPQMRTAHDPHVLKEVRAQFAKYRARRASR